MVRRMSVQPTEVHLRQAERRLEITWDDGVVTQFSLRFLRGWCPCAKCQGHFVNEMKFIEGVSTDLSDVQPVGGYALRPTWADGHQSGIYAFRYLRKIATEPPGEGPTNDDLLVDA